MFSLFPMSAIITADTPEVLGKGKPKPDIFLVAANAIGSYPVSILRCAEPQAETSVEQMSAQSYSWRKGDEV